MKAVIIIEGGIVQEVIADNPDLELMVIDYDTDYGDPEDFTEIPKRDKTTELVYIYEGDVLVEDAHRVEELFNVKDKS